MKEECVKKQSAHIDSLRGDDSGAIVDLNEKGANRGHG
jgi:hypothetical protein